MWLMLQQDGAGRLRHRDRRSRISVRELCEIAFERVGLDYEQHVVIDPRFFRPAEVDHLLGDASRARARSRLGSRRSTSGAHRDDGRRRHGAAPAGLRDPGHRLTRLRRTVARSAELERAGHSGSSRVARRDGRLEVTDRAAVVARGRDAPPRCRHPPGGRIAAPAERGRSRARALGRRRRDPRRHRRARCPRRAGRRLAPSCSSRGSSEVYGAPAADDLPLSEASPLRPATAYAS